jgi:hypothetical protein
MSAPLLPTRDAIRRLSDLTSRYREAFEQVQDCLANAEMGRIPAWVFAVERLKIEDVAELSEDLAAAESKRRSLRVALHALVEFIALEDLDMEAPRGRDSEVDELITAMDDQEDESARKLDRFISVINYAKNGGCIYLNGTFEPVIRSPQNTPKGARRTPDIPATVPQGEGMALPDPDTSITGASEDG